MKFRNLYCLLCIAVLSCSNPLEKKYSKETLTDDLKAILDYNDNDSAAIKSIIGYSMLATLTKEDLSNKTYEEIVKLHKEAMEKIAKAEKERELLAKQAILEENERRDRLSKTVTLAVFSKGYDAYDYREFLTYGIVISNNSSKEIRAIKGEIVFNDLFDQKIKEIDIVYDTPIKAMNKAKETYTTEYNQFMDADERLRSKKLEDIKVVWNPQKIIFSDGTTLE